MRSYIVFIELELPAVVATGAHTKSNAILIAGDFVNIPAHRKHRVEWTTVDEPTIWLAVFYRD